MSKTGAISPSVSPWASPVVIVKKKDGQVRFCIDYRQLNAVTKGDVYPLPRIDDLLDALADARVFSCLDAAAGYWQIPMATQAREKTAFITSEGLYEFNVMPFGLKNAPATYQRFMNGIMGGLLWIVCLCYLDDLIVFSKTWEEHPEHLRQVFERVRQAKLVLKGAKCEFAKTELRWLGHEVSSNGIRADPAKVEVVRNYPVPRDVRTLRGFLGLTNYYRKFCRTYAAIAAPLNELTRDGIDYVWTDACQKGFEQLRNAIVERTLLARPDTSLPFIVDTDASTIGIGGVLSQVQDGVEVPILFLSRSLQPQERKWHIRELEALAIIYTLEQCRHHLLGHKFHVRTDHSSLNVLFKATSGRLARWALRLAEFELPEVKYRKGDLQGNADAFTRWAEYETVPEHMVMSMGKLTTTPVLTAKALREAQLSDSWCIGQSEEMDNGCRPNFVRQDDIIAMRAEPRNKPLVPASLRKIVLKATHGLAHLGGKKLASLVKARYFWPAIDADAKEFVASCVPCRRRKTVSPKGAKLSSKPPTEPWRTVAMDFYGPIAKTSTGYQYVLVFVDHFTKWVQLCPTKDQRSTTVVKHLLKAIIANHGLPRYLLSDRGSHFKSETVESVCRALGIRKVYASSYYPQGDGYAERFMRTLGNSISLLMHDAGPEWQQHIPLIQLAYNAAVHPATGHSPFELACGRVPTLPGEGSGLPLEGTHPLKATFEKVRKDAKAAVDLYWSRMKEHYDAHRSDWQLEVGDKVIVELSPTEKAKFGIGKLAPRFSGPRTIVGLKSNGASYDVQREDGTVEVKNASQVVPLGRVELQDEQNTDPDWVATSRSNPHSREEIAAWKPDIPSLVTEEVEVLLSEEEREDLPSVNPGTLTKSQVSSDLDASSAANGVTQRSGPSQESASSTTRLSETGTGEADGGQENQTGGEAAIEPRPPQQAAVTHTRGLQKPTGVEGPVYPEVTDISDDEDYDLTAEEGELFE
jgi:transposase InsO family protein